FPCKEPEEHCRPERGGYTEAGRNADHSTSTRRYVTHLGRNRKKPQHAPGHRAPGCDSGQCDLGVITAALSDPQQRDEYDAADESGYCQRGRPDIADLPVWIVELHQPTKAEAPSKRPRQDHEDRTADTANPLLHSCLRMRKLS